MPVVVPSGAPVLTPSQDATSYDGAVRAVDDPAFGGVRIKIDLAANRSQYRNPFTCTVYREDPDGTVLPVRGGDPYINYAGRGWLYDQEAPLGAVVQYYAVPLGPDGAPANPTASAVILTSAPQGGYRDPGVWLVSLENPEHSLQVRTQTSLGGTYGSRVDKQVILGSPYPAVTLDTRSSLTTKMAVLTAGPDEYAALRTLVGEDVVFRKSIDWERPDGYYLIEDVTVTSVSRLGQGFYAWDLTLTQIDRMDTYGQTVEIPGRTFTARRARYPLFQDSHIRAFGGNFLTENAYALETSADDWTAGPNTTRAWYTGLGLVGPHSVALTSGAAGDISMSAPAVAAPVTPGRSYRFGAWVYTGSLGIPARLALTWMDGFRATLSTTTGPPTTIDPGGWTPLVLTATAPPGAVFLQPVLTATVSGSAQTVYADALTVEEA